MRHRSFPPGETSEAAGSGNLVVAAVPNAGYATGSRIGWSTEITPATSASDGGDAGQGVNIIGGCCGTNPGYIRKLSQAAGGRPWLQKGFQDRPEQRAESEIRYDNNPFIRKLYSGEKVVIAELDPPFDGNDRRDGGMLRLS